MTTETLDLDYIRRVGEETRTALFPRQRYDGRQPYPSPVELDYKLPDGDEVTVKFVSCRTYYRIGEEAPDVNLSLVDVTFMGHYVGAVDLSFGNEFEGDENELIVQQDPNPELDVPLMALLKAVAGTL